VIRRRDLSDEDHALWRGYTRSITPLRPRRNATEPAPVPSVAPPAPAVRITCDDIKPPKPPALAPLDRRLKQRVARGREPIEARIDLHGMTQAQAHASLLRFLRGAQANGAKVALVVTGKGSGGAPRSSERAAERGVLRRQVPMWLEQPEFRGLVLSFGAAHASHGGEGALYVRLRRPR
jgi:DNA-nicking Smr family endonuclease